jgi:hypothetical protein
VPVFVEEDDAVFVAEGDVDVVGSGVRSGVRVLEGVDDVVRGLVRVAVWDVLGVPVCVELGVPVEVLEGVLVGLAM